MSIEPRPEPNWDNARRYFYATGSAGGAVMVCEVDGCQMDHRGEHLVGVLAREAMDRYEVAQTDYNVGAWVAAGCVALCTPRQTIGWTVGSSVVVPVTGPGGLVGKSPSEVRLIARHPDKRWSRGYSEAEALDDWFDQYDTPPPPDLARMLSARSQRICDMTRDGFSRTEATVHVARAGAALSAHFNAWGYAATRGRTLGDCGRRAGDPATLRVGVDWGFKSEGVTMVFDGERWVEQC